MDYNFTYEELLARPEWQKLRAAKLRLAKNTCERCSNSVYERDGFYGPYIFPLNSIPERSVFWGFDGSAEQIVNAWYPECAGKKVMLYFLKHRASGISDRPEEGYFVAAARELNEGEIIYYFQRYLPGSSQAREITEALLEGRSIESAIIPEDKTLRPKTCDETWLLAKDLHVHHTYYRIDKMPWEYPDESLQVLCRSCHETVHATQVIPVKDQNEQIIGRYNPCKRCNGAGWFPEYSHVQGGICFACGGRSYLSREFISAI